MPPGYYIEWSGQYENQISAKKRLELVIPVVFLIIFLSALQNLQLIQRSLHVILAVPFALTRRRLSPEAAGVQLLRRGLGRLHRPVRHGRADRRRDGDLPGRGRGTKESRDGHALPCRVCVKL